MAIITQGFKIYKVLIPFQFLPNSIKAQEELKNGVPAPSLKLSILNILLNRKKAILSLFIYISIFQFKLAGLGERQNSS